MKTAVSIPDDVFEQAERFAKKAKKSRSKLFSDALREYLARHTGDEVTDAMNRTLAEVGEDSPEWITASARNVLKRSEW